MEKIKRYVLFGGWYYYPEGGADDILGSFYSLEELKVEFNKCVSKSIKRDINSEGEWIIGYDRLEEKEVLIHRP
jgi:hypothetical protein